MNTFEPRGVWKNAHVQTLMGSLKKQTLPHIPYSLWEFSRGSITLSGKLSLGERSRSVVVFYHGLGGTCDSHYMVSAAFECWLRGFSVLRMNLRGAQEYGPQTPHLYHSGLTEDLTANLEQLIRRSFDNIYFVGFSLSANTILKWLGEKKQNIAKACVVSPPVNLLACSKKIDAPKNWIYQRYFLKKLKCIMNSKQEHFPDLFSHLNTKKAYTSLWNFDENVTAPFFGFENAADYLTQSSAYSTLNNIQNNVKMIHAHDDPFVSSEELKLFSKHAPDNITLRLFTHGGHVGFYDPKLKSSKINPWLADYFLET